MCGDFSTRSIAREEPGSPLAETHRAASKPKGTQSIPLIENIAGSVQA